MAKPEPKEAAFDLDAALDEIERSGSTVAAFARERSLPMWKLYEGLRRRRRHGHAKDGHTELELIPVHLTPVRTAEVSFELVLQGGRTLRIPGTFDEPVLQRLVRALESC